MSYCPVCGYPFVLTKRRCTICQRKSSWLRRLLARFVGHTTEKPKPPTDDEWDRAEFLERLRTRKPDDWNRAYSAQWSESYQNAMMQQSLGMQQASAQQQMVLREAEARQLQNALAPLTSPYGQQQDPFWGYRIVMRSVRWDEEKS